jgi:hypothetical protein
MEATSPNPPLIPTTPSQLLYGQQHQQQYQLQTQKSVTELSEEIKQLKDFCTQQIQELHNNQQLQLRKIHNDVTERMINQDRRIGETIQTELDKRDGKTVETIQETIKSSIQAHTNPLYETQQKMCEILSRLSTKENRLENAETQTATKRLCVPNRTTAHVQSENTQQVNNDTLLLTQPMDTGTATPL